MLARYRRRRRRACFALAEPVACDGFSGRAHLHRPESLHAL